MPFKVSFLESYGSKIEIKECNNFKQSWEIDYLKSEQLLVENTLLSLSFKAPQGYRLYFDGLDQLESFSVHEDENGLYLLPSDVPYSLYNPSKRNKPYPFIPGTYFLTVISPNKEIYETRIRITTKRVTENQHGLMINEIEMVLRGLSKQTVRNRRVYNEAALNIFGPTKIDEYSTILSNKEKIIGSLSIIKKRLRYSVVKKHPIIPRYKAKKIDGRSIKYLMIHPEQQKTIQAPVSNVTYDLPENRWIKGIVYLLIKYTKEMMSFFVNPYQPNYDILQAADLKRELITLQTHLTEFMHDRQIEEVKASTSGKVPMALLSVGSYSVLFRLYQYLKKGSNTQAAQPRLQFHYKRSDLIYEIWGYLKVVEFLQEQEFKVLKSWLRPNAGTLDDSIVPSREEIDYVELKRGNCIIRVFYDELLPRRKRDLSPLKTIHTMNNNRPDCRIDIWLEGDFKGSFIIDFKYRKKEYLWSDSDLDRGNPSKVMSQLEAYAQSTATDTQLLNEKKNFIVDYKPVSEVWAVYPNMDERKGKIKKVDDYNIHLVELSPGLDDSHFTEMLSRAIEHIINRS